MTTKLATLQYTHAVYENQPYANKPRNIIGDLLFVWEGTMQLSPSNDQWVDTEILPEMQVEIGPSNEVWDAIGSQLPWSTEWGAWETTWTGTTPTTKTVTARTFDQSNVVFDNKGNHVSGTAIVGSSTRTITQNVASAIQEREGVSTSLAVEQELIDLGNRIIDVSLAHFMRSRAIIVDVANLKPNTRLYAFFDDVDVTDNCAPIVAPIADDDLNRIQAAVVFGGDLVTDENGSLSFVFLIPGGQFNVGTKTLVVCDDPQNRGDFVTTIATAPYTASGLVTQQQRTVVSTQSVEIVREPVTETRTQTTSVQSPNNPSTWIARPPRPFPSTVPDPLAQTFYINQSGGVFLSKLDLYFRTKSSTHGIKIQIREVDNGLPTGNLIPYGEIVVAADDVNVSEDATLATSFVFENPVYLQHDTEYCFVVMPIANSPDYEAWVAELGEFDITTSERIVKSPASGVLFSSSNNRTWTPYQKEDMKYVAHIANFSPLTGTLVMTNKDIDFFTLEELTGTFAPGEVVFGEPLLELNASAEPFDKDVGESITTTSGTFEITEIDYPFIKVKLTNASIVPLVNETFDDDSAETWTIIDVVIPKGIVTKYKLPTMELINSNGFFETGDNIIGFQSGVSGIISSIDDYALNMLHLNVAELQISGVYVNWYVKTTQGTSVGDYTPIINNQDNEFKDEYIVMSKSNEVLLLSGAKSLVIKGELVSLASNLSPVVDLNMIDAIITNNIINDPETLDEALDGVSNGEARYISSAVILADDQDAEDLVVYLQMLRPYGTDVRVFYKILHSEDNTSIADREWVEMEEEKKVFNNSAEIEAKYTVPASELDGDGVINYDIGSATFTGYKTFLIKIVMTTTNTGIVPTVRNLRAIALQR